MPSRSHTQKSTSSESFVEIKEDKTRRGPEESRKETCAPGRKPEIELVCPSFIYDPDPLLRLLPGAHVS